MNYTVEQVLDKLNITRYKFNKLRKYGYLNPITLSEWNGMYYIDVLYISDSELKKLTPKRLENIFLKIKKTESRDLMSKWEKKVFNLNSKFLHNHLDVGREFEFKIDKKKDVTEYINSNIRISGDNFTELKKPIKLEDNSNFKVLRIGSYLFDFWKNPIFDNNDTWGYLEPKVCCNYGDVIIANVTVDVIEVTNKKTNDFDWFGLITEFSPISTINEECECCGRIIKIPGRVYSYGEHEVLCLGCYSDLIEKDRAEKYRNNLLSCSDTIILDFETAGLDSSKGIVSIAAIDMSGNVLLDVKVKPHGEITPGATELHGLTSEVLKNEKTFCEIKDSIVNTIKSKTVIFSHEFHEDFFRDFLSMNGIQQVNDDFEYLYDSLVIADILKSCHISPRNFKSYDALNDCYNMLNWIRF